jgi:choline dehydrogenase-like flavoprotein
MPAAPNADPQLIAKTHAAMFDTWFPLDALPIPPSVKPEIAAIAAKVSAGMLEALIASPLMSAILGGMTYPTSLPFYSCLTRSQYPAVQAFLAAVGGYGGLAKEQREPLFSFFFDGSCGADSTMFAMLLREAYISGIWDLPLAVPLTGIQAPPVFMQNPDIYSKFHAPVIPPSRLYYDQQSNTIKHRDGPIDCIVIGSGPGGATVAQQLWEAGKRVVLIEKGPWVIWGSMDTRSYPNLMFQQDKAATSDNGIILRSGETMGGGTTVNIDLAFSPLEATIQARIGEWKQKGLIDARFYTQEDIALAYQWVREKIQTRQLLRSELNQDNKVLWDGAEEFGVDPKLYHLNRYRVGYSPSPVDDKRDAAKQLILPAATDTKNPLSVIPDALVAEVLFETVGDSRNVRATGVSVTMNAPWTTYGNTIVDPCDLKIPVGATVTFRAENVVLAAGTIGTTRVLLNTAKNNPAVANPRIGKGLILHPSFPMIGVFDRQINLLQGLDSATFVDAFGVVPGFIFETMGGLPAYGAVLIPGGGEQVYENIANFNVSAGFGVMLVDTPSDDNCITLNDRGDPVLTYALSEADKKRFRTGVAVGIRMMFLAGAKKVIIPSNENLLGDKDFDPMRGVYLTDINQADLVEQHLNFIPNRTVLTAAHIQAADKIGPSPDIAVVSTRQRVWNVITGEEIPNLYVMDSSIFPTSVGANPMQSIYTFAKIFSARFLHGMDEVHHSPMRVSADAHARLVASRAAAAVTEG